MNHYYIVSSTGARDCTVYDITGEQIHYQKSKAINVSRVTLDLDRRIFHENFNVAKLEKLLGDHGDDVEQEQHLEREAWFVLRARKPGVNVRDLARQYGLEELRDYIDRSRRDIDAIRGWPFPQRWTGLPRAPAVSDVNQLAGAQRFSVQAIMYTKSTGGCI